MKHIAELLLSFALLLGAVEGVVIKTCELYKDVADSGCTNTDPIRFLYTGLNEDTDNSLCRRTYRLVIDLQPTDRGYSCTFTFDTPDQNAYVYSIAESPLATSATSGTPYIYGYGLHATLSSKTISTAKESARLRNVHRHPDENNYSTITYRVENGKVTISGTAGHRIIFNQSQWFRPEFRRAYIGLNRRYRDTVRQGSGLCKARCYTF